MTISSLSWMWMGAIQQFPWHQPMEDIQLPREGGSVKLIYTKNFRYKIVYYKGVHKSGNDDME